LHPEAGGGLLGASAPAEFGEKSQRSAAPKRAANAQQLQGSIMNRSVIASLLAGAVLAFSGAAADAQDAIKFGVAAEPYPPFASPDAAGQWVGFEVDLMDAVCAEMKAKCELVPVAWDGIIPSLQEKKIDVIWASMSITEKRKQVIDFTEMYYDTPAVFVAAKSSDIQISDEGLKGKIIGVQTSTTHADFATQEYGDVAEIKIYDTQDNANADLVAGRVDVLLADAIALDAFIKSDQGGDYEVKSQAPDHPIFGEGVGGGLRKEDDDLEKNLNAAIKSLLDSGKYNEIAKKYFDFDISGRTS
jgi:polar amino acid transport system substrate-binding protein